MDLSIKGSHKSLVNIEEEVHLTGKKGEAYLVYFFVLHSGRTVFSIIFLNRILKIIIAEFIYENSCIT